MGHNALYDCIFTLDKFLVSVDGTFDNFKEAFNENIKGAFYDTKLIAQRFMVWMGSHRRLPLSSHLSLTRVDMDMDEVRHTKNLKQKNES